MKIDIFYILIPVRTKSTTTTFGLTDFGLNLERVVDINPLSGDLDIRNFIISATFS